MGGSGAEGTGAFFPFVGTAGAENFGFFTFDGLGQGLMGTIVLHGWWRGYPDPPGRGGGDPSSRPKITKNFSAPAAQRKKNGP